MVCIYDTEYSSVNNSDIDCSHVKRLFNVIAHTAT